MSFPDAARYALFPISIAFCLAVGPACSDSHRSADAGSGGALQPAAGSGHAGSAAPGPAGTGGSAGSIAAGSGDPRAGRSGAAGGAGRAGAGGTTTPPPATATEFVVHNEGEDVLLLGTNCGGHWLTIAEQGQTLGYDRSCSCPCEDTRVCGCPAVCLNTQQLVMPGLSASMTWDGLGLVFSHDGCYTSRVPERGSKLSAKACWNQPRGEDNGSCNEQWFAYGQDTLVTFPAKSAPDAASTTTLGLENGSGGPIEIVKEHCGLQGWFELDMGKGLSVHAFCACGCNADFKPSQCPSCGQCADDVIQTLEPGQRVTFDWDGKFSYDYESGCTNTYSMPAGTQVRAKLCWRKPDAADATCGTLYFEPGQPGPNLLQAY